MPTNEEVVQKYKGEAYKRPEHVKIPTVWERFQGKTPRPDGTYPKFKVQDVTDEWVEEIVSCVPLFLRGVTGDSMNHVPESARESFNMMQAAWRVILKDKVSLMCLTDDEATPRLVGFQLNEICNKVRTKEDIHPDANQGMTMMLNGFMKTRQAVNVLKHYVVTEYMDAWELFTKEEFRNQGIAYHIQNAKKPLCKALGIKVIANGFGSDIAQHIASKLGFELLTKNAMDEVHPTMKESNVQMPEQNRFLTVMGIRVE